MALAPMARVSNAVTDLMLCCMHTVFLVRALRHKRASQLRLLVMGYCAATAAWQTIGAVCHLFLPTPRELSPVWFAYIVLGALCGSLFGVILSLDTFRGRSGRWLAAGFVCLWVAYTVGAVAQVDLAEFLPLPRDLEVTLSPLIARALGGTGWMESALKAAKQKVAGEGPLTLRFDGRGYACTPFAEAFDAKHRQNDDLVAAFPDFRTHSLAFLFLCFAVGANGIMILIAAFGAMRASGARQRRARMCFRAHCGMAFALTTMPVAMVCGGVPAGIDWMHMCVSPGMFFQCRACELALDELAADDDEARKKRA